MGQRFDSMGASVGHVKLIVEAGNNFLMGNLTGKTWMAILAWLISWAILANKWGDQKVDFGKIYKATLILVGLGLLATFPPFFDLF